ncbi:cytochrome c biogenesis CcdA family protein [Sporomusa acidovorans]|uniref:Thiol:disulfide interchange protein DsbD n=1 Tax=Sporomusa acidovorans (strain ATCC 49682 / DSM 3132 / Mol) TaxID=1123286 RepID=A0ABZ3J1Q6_SPOA4|nr:cytochrome c biogenesis protein CcdA [Sporomusa acidovorans]OZC14989.1 thiol:disulfide interchange protein DsbD precursor [Sporomusa acidovorans DSM 3132]SDE83539.1 cytochrome c-type biogenesis protein [Sporomusa acidovorans]
MDYNLTLVTVFGAGVVSFLSPCVLPMLPTYAALLAGTGTQTQSGLRQWLFIVNALSFLSGFALTFIAMGATASLIGEFFFYYQEVIRKVGAVFMAIMGLQLLGLIKIPCLDREYRPLLQGAFAGPFGAFLLGLAFTAGWTPCTGPILATVLMYAGSAATVVQGAFLLFVYAMGFCLPFLFLALVLNRYLDQIKGLYKWLPLIQQAAGAVLVAAGILIYFDWLQKAVGLVWGIFN